MSLVGIGVREVTPPALERTMVAREDESLLPPPPQPAKTIATSAMHKLLTNNELRVLRMLHLLEDTKT